VSQPDRPIRLILDTSALLTYLTGSLHVGEPLHEVVEEGAVFAVPSPAAAEALAEVDDGHDRALLIRLLDHGSCNPLPAPGDAWLDLAYWRRVTGRIDLAACALAALDYDAAVLTAEGGRYGEGVPVIDIEDA
jgi:hypothetical protein